MSVRNTVLYVLSWMGWVVCWRAMYTSNGGGIGVLSMTLISVYLKSRNKKLGQDHHLVIA